MHIYTGHVVVIPIDFVLNNERTKLPNLIEMVKSYADHITLLSVYKIFPYKSIHAVLCHIPYPLED